MIGNIVLSSNGSYTGFVAAKNLYIPSLERAFWDIRLVYSDFDEMDTYLDGNPDFADTRAGTNKSDEDDFLETSSIDQFYRINMRYLLPVGDGAKTIINRLTLDRGILYDGSEGGGNWNPAESGRMFFELMPFYRFQDLESEIAGDTEVKTSGVEFALRRYNVDYLDNPSFGSTQQFVLSRDWGKLGSSDSWTTWEIEYSKYFQLPKLDWAQQQVIAFNFWTIGTPTWEEENGEIRGRSPFFAGATLGGVERLRAYPTARFNDRSAIYYSLEYRVTSDWNPLEILEKVFSRLQMDWMQIVPFFELGRVGGSWNADRLHKDMKWDAGLDLRFLVNHLVVRGGFAYGEEGGLVQMFITHPFPNM